MEPVAVHLPLRQLRGLEVTVLPRRSVAFKFFRPTAYSRSLDRSTASGVVRALTVRQPRGLKVTVLTVRL